MYKRQEYIQNAENTVQGHEMRVQQRRKRAEAVKAEADRQMLDAKEKERRAGLLEDLERNLEGFTQSVKTVMRESTRGNLRGKMCIRDSDYINCPMNKEEYDAFYEALINAERAPIHDFDVMNPKVYEGCMPIEVMAQRGHDTIRFGPLKPVGLRDPRTGHRPWACLLYTSRL